MGWEIFRFGTLYVEGEPVKDPQDPTIKGDIPSYNSLNSQNSTPGSIKISDTKPGSGISWVKPDDMNLFIADRSLLVHVSWSDLEQNGFIPGCQITIDGKYYLCRLLQVGTPNTEEIENESSEWQQILEKTTEADGVWHWNKCYFWGHEKKDRYYCMATGYHGPFCLSLERHNARCSFIGLRPVLEPLPSVPHPLSQRIMLDGQEFILSQLPGATREVFYPTIYPACSTQLNTFKSIPDGNIIKMYSILLNGKPVRQDVATREVEADLSKAAITLTDEFYGEKFLIPWVISNGVAIASRPLLKGDWIS